jgi:formate dehydrogenase major subunit
MRGESNVQGSTDYALLYHILPGYLNVPVNTDVTLAKYIERVTPVTKDPKSLNWWGNTPKYITSLLKAWYGDAATKENDFGFHYLPKPQSGVDYSHIPLFEAMEKGTIKGFMVWGQNPAVGGPNAEAERRALGMLDWLIVADMWHTETANFWRRPGANPADIKTEVFLLPALNSYEKEGSVTNSGRWMQWRYKCADGPGDARADLDIINELMMKLREMYNREGGANADSVNKLVWDYGSHVDPNKVAKEINGYDLKTGKLMASFAALQSDGSTSCGNWVYCASYTEAGNMAARRNPVDKSGIGLYSEWAWCWPVNRRIVYNRASVDLNGNPWDPEHPVIKWNATDKKWEGDVADGAQPPMNVDPTATKYPFIMRSEGVACLFSANVGPRETSMTDGPLPEHYEPWEAPVKNLMSGQQNDPCFKIFRPQEQGTPDKYPIVCSTYRVVEHWQAGQMTRNSAWLVELMPEMFVELSEELAAEKGIVNGGKLVVETMRGSITAVAVVTKRYKPFTINGRRVHQIGMPFHWGYVGLSTGDSANSLTPYIGDANTNIPEYKAFLCDVRKA